MGRARMARVKSVILILDNGQALDCKVHAAEFVPRGQYAPIKREITRSAMGRAWHAEIDLYVNGLLEDPVREVSSPRRDRPGSISKSRFQSIELEEGD
jgi:hypothetical protein